MAKQIIVDENDNVIGTKERDQIGPEDIYRITALWLTNSKGEVLIARRALSKLHDPGMWAVAVAGTVDEGETYDQNMVKEAEEELGIKGVKLKPLYKDFVVSIRGDNQHKYFKKVYWLDKDYSLKDLKFDPREVMAIKWIFFDDLIKDVKVHPENYVPSFGKSLQKYMLISKNGKIPC
jgi:isopentenyl-diphosphate delta-isomerase